MTYMLFYSEQYKCVLSQIYSTDIRIHLEKYGRVNTAHNTIVKKQNILFFELPDATPFSWKVQKAHIDALTTTLSQVYNPNKNNLATYTPENYPELYI